jgi:mono/diheme cytochrome c family protein
MTRLPRFLGSPSRAVGPRVSQRSIVPGTFVTDFATSLTRIRSGCLSSVAMAAGLIVATAGQTPTVDSAEPPPAVSADATDQPTLAEPSAPSATAVQQSAGPTKPTVEFERHVRPILKAHCFHCHGEEAELQGGFDARLARFVHRGGDSGRAVVPHRPDESLLVQRIVSGEMPPGKIKVPATELAIIQTWVSEGAAIPADEPDALQPGDVLSTFERRHWSFQPIDRPTVPDSTSGTSFTRNPLDRFVAAEWDQKGLTASAEADRITLARRLSFDLRGLPPTPEEIEEFLADETEWAYERLVDRWLSSPQYGERWARHWLDVAGYADSEGYTEADPVRPWAWKYRDYVIEAFNADRPWDQLIVEQLAGDELVPPPYSNLSAENARRLIATGFLRMAPDGTVNDSVDQDVARNDVVAEQLKIVSSSLLGLTVGCAQCHAHRFDPISRVDYYRLRAVFEPAYNPAQWRRPQQRLISQWSDDTAAKAREADANLQALTEQRLKELDEIVTKTFEAELLKLPAEQQPLARTARETPEAQQTPEQQQLIKDNPFLKVDRGSVYLYLPDRLTGFNTMWDDKLAEARRQRPADDLIACLTEIPGAIPVTHLFARGDLKQPREAVSPSELGVIPCSPSAIPDDDPTLPTSGRRLAYARHLTSGQHPLVGRVLVNRFWMHHFGRGLVTTPGDFGIAGSPPSHPELLDWLAREWMDAGWQWKRLQRTIVTSATYRQQSTRLFTTDAIDPDNTWLSRMPVRRLDAESVRDALLFVAGRLSDRMTGPPVPVTPDEVGQIIVGEDTRDSAGRPTGKVVDLGENQYRRSVYVQVRRSMPLGLLEPFDAPVMSPNCESRNRSTAATQALLMMNNSEVVELSRATAVRLRGLAGADRSELVRLAWRSAFGRQPDEHEQQTAVAFLDRQTQRLQTAGATDAKPRSEDDALTDAVTTLCQTLLSSNEFLYVD